MATFRLASARAVLERTPAALRSLLAGLPDEWVEDAGREGSWRAFDIVGHLIHGDLEDWVPRTRVVLEHGESQPFHPFDRAGLERAIAGKTLADLLDDFANVRARCLEELDGFGLDDASLDRTGRHPEFGSVTLRELLATWTVHDLSHVGQIADSMARRYRDEVGPWRRFLPVLDRPEEDSG